jgi:hypothetical protein
MDGEGGDRQAILKAAMEAGGGIDYFIPKHRRIAAGETANHFENLILSELLTLSVAAFRHSIRVHKIG